MTAKRRIGTDEAMKRAAGPKRTVDKTGSVGSDLPEVQAEAKDFIKRHGDQPIPADRTGTLRGEEPYSPLPEVDRDSGEPLADSPLEHAVNMMADNRHGERTRESNRGFLRGFGRIGKRRKWAKDLPADWHTWTLEELARIAWRLENPTTCVGCGVADDRPLYARGMHRSCYDRTRPKRKGRR